MMSREFGRNHAHRRDPVNPRPLTMDQAVNADFANKCANVRKILASKPGKEEEVRAAWLFR